MVHLGVPGAARSGEAAIDAAAERNPAAARTLLRAVTDQLAAVPNRGMDYGLLRYPQTADRTGTWHASPVPRWSSITSAATT